MGLYSRAVDLLTDRLQQHVENGLLKGWNFRRELASEVEGRSTLPWLRFNSLMPVEDHSPQDVLRATLEVGLLLATDVRLGPSGLLSALELLLDAIETTVAGKVDPAFSLLESGVSIRATNLFATAVALHLSLIVSMKLPRTRRGSRRV